MISKPAGHRRVSLAKITANFEFTATGYLHAVYLNAETDSDQETLKRALKRLLRPDHIGWFQRLLRRT